MHREHLKVWDYVEWLVVGTRIIIYFDYWQLGLNFIILIVMDSYDLIHTATWKTRRAYQTFQKIKASSDLINPLKYLKPPFHDTHPKKRSDTPVSVLLEKLLHISP
jgi:hypothetical protein